MTAPNIHPANFPRVRLLGMPLAALTNEQVIAHILDELDAGRGGWVVTPNLDILRRFVRDRSFAELVEPATMCVADGMPLVWASRIQGAAVPERVAGSDLISTISAAAATRGKSVYLLGGSEGTAERAGEVLRDRHPELTVAGHHCPPFGFEKSDAEMDVIRTKMRDANPDICYVGLGCPKQEYLIEALRHDHPGTWFLGIGNSFSFLCGEVKRAPGWAQKTGLEWIHRVMSEPSRLAKRYLVDGLPFAAFLAWSAVVARFTKPKEALVLPAEPGS